MREIRILAPSGGSRPQDLRVKVEGGNGVWEEFVAKVHEVAQTNPSLRALAEPLASHPLSPQ